MCGAGAAPADPDGPAAGLAVQLPPSRFPQHSGTDAAMPPQPAAAWGATAGQQQAAEAPAPEPAARRGGDGAAARVLGALRPAAAPCSSQADVLNDADIRDLLGAVEACVARPAAGPGQPPPPPPPRTPRVHWHDVSAGGGTASDAAAAPGLPSSPRKRLPAPLLEAHRPTQLLAAAGAGPPAAAAGAAAPGSERLALAASGLAAAAAAACGLPEPLTALRRASISLRPSSSDPLGGEAAGPASAAGVAPAACARAAGGQTTATGQARLSGSGAFCFTSAVGLRCSAAATGAVAPAVAQPPVAPDGQSDAASSCCDGQSDVSALAHPMAFADTLRRRVDLHLGPAPAASAPAAEAPGGADSPVTPRRAAQALEEFFAGRAPLQRKAGGWRPAALAPQPGSGRSGRARAGRCGRPPSSAAAPLRSLLPSPPPARLKQNLQHRQQQQLFEQAKTACTSACEAAAAAVGGGRAPAPAPARAPPAASQGLGRRLHAAGAVGGGHRSSLNASAPLRRAPLQASGGAAPGWGTRSLGSQRAAPAPAGAAPATSEEGAWFVATVKHDLERALTLAHAPRATGGDRERGGRA
ncbi:hypothetical protein HT031_005576 [Scenedesmus sp. PABB004]|nr:hypothetical protein HT031_005576 [Scenedesmus sp. PABB004]